MLINRGTLTTLGTGFKAAFQGGLGMATPDHLRIASVVPSSTAKEEYGWLGKFPNMREWIGDRVLNSISQSGYAIRNKDWEVTVEVDRNDIQDDNLGQYSLFFQEMGMSVTAHPSQLVFALLKAGFTTNCYDGQFFFDVDHPVIDENGNEQSVANTDGGAGTPWFLLDTSRALKPIIYQERKKPDWVGLDNPDDPNVFSRKTYVYGVDSRDNVGFGFWQFAWGSRQPLNAANYATARAALSSMKGDGGRPLGINPNLLVVPPSLESNALKIINNELGANGETNEWKGTAEVFKTPWLA